MDSPPAQPPPHPKGGLFYLETFWHQLEADRAEVTVPSNTCAGRATLGLVFSYVTARPYCCTGWCGVASVTSAPCSRGAGSALRGLLRVDVHVLRVSQQADALFLLSLFCHLIRKTHRHKADSSRRYGSGPLPLTGIQKFGAWQLIVLIDPSIKACKRSYSEGTASNLSSDESGRIQTTNNETRPRQISEIKQSK